MPSKVATFLGLLAIVLWGSSIALVRSLQESVGVLTGACWVCLLSGTIGTMALLLRRDRRQGLMQLSRPYWLGCGGMFVAYMVCLYMAVGLAGERRDVINVGIINYLWPGLTLILSIFRK